MHVPHLDGVLNSNIKLKNTPKIFFPLLFVLFFIGATTVLHAQDQPNIILIMCDYMGYADTEPFGSHDIKTPSISKLAEQGVKYTNFYSAAPVCSPARGAILTGLYPFHNGIETNMGKSHEGLTSKFPSIASKLKKQGYRTAFIGKWHLGYSEEASANANGFDHYFGFNDWSIDYYSHKTHSGSSLYKNDRPIEVEGYITNVFTDNAIEFINEQPSKPFFLSLFYNAPLPPLQVPGKPKDIRDKTTWHNNTREDYVKVVENVDENIGRILEDLKKKGLFENTIVVFTYDHGGKDYVNHGELFHGFATLWEGGIRVPLIIRHPLEKKPNTIDSRLAINMDVTATLLNAASVPIEDLDGVDLLSNEIDIERELHWKFRSQSAIRQGKWKLIYDASSKLLFNLDEDPSERYDVGYKFPSVKDNLIDKLELWKKEIKN